MIREIDHEIYNRYKHGHDGTMDKYLQWYESGGWRTRKVNGSQKTVFKKAIHIIKRLRNDHTASEIAEMIGIGQNLVYQLQVGDPRCSEQTAQKIIDYDN